MQIVNYTQGGYTPPASCHVDDETYQRVSPMWAKACVDVCLFVKGPASLEIVMGHRRNPPLKDQWWFPGGRILPTDDHVYGAASRKVREDLGIRIAPAAFLDAPSMLQFFRWQEDGTVALALMLFHEIGEQHWDQIRSEIPQGDFSTVLRVSAISVIEQTQHFHELARGVARQAMNLNG